MSKYFTLRPRTLIKNYVNWVTLYDVDDRLSIDVNKDGGLLLKSILGRNQESVNDLILPLAEAEKKYIREFIENLLRRRWLYLMNKPQGDPVVLNGPLEAVYIEIHRVCNLSCEHCYLPEWKSAMSYAEFSRILEEARELGAYKISITGGEPSIHKDIMRMIKRAYDLMFGVNVQTNGVLLTKEIVDKLAEYKVSITSSLDGLEREHDQFRGLKGAFQRTLEGIRSAKEAGLPVRVNITLHTGNVGSVRKLSLLLREIGVDEINAFYPIFTGKAQTMKHIVSPIAAVQTLVDNEDALCYRKHYQRALSSSNCTFCGIAETFLFVTATGDVTVCPSFSGDPALHLGNIRKLPLKQIYHSEKRRQLLFDLRCRLASVCPHGKGCKGGCRSRAYYSNKLDLSAPDSIFCQLWDRLYPRN